MFKYIFLSILLLFLNINTLAQNYFYYSRHVSLPHKNISARTVDLKYPINMENVMAIGMGNTQIANGKKFNAMMYNPAFLGEKKSSVEVLGIQFSLPPATYDAASFLSGHINEFTEAISLTEVWEGVNDFFETGATYQQRLDALSRIQNGMTFTIDLFTEVTGSPDDPQKHGISILPSFSIQKDNWGFSFYGFGHSGFVVQQSTTLDALLDIDIPSNLNKPIQAAKSLAELLGILGTVVIGGGESFSNEVFPVAFYISYIDIVGAVGYGFRVKDNLKIGANLKVINRRFITDRIAVIDYDEILSGAWEGLKSDVTGVTFDIGGLYQFKFGTSVGLSLQNLIPVQTITKSIDTNFRVPNINYDRDLDGHFITNDNGDTALVSTFRNITVNRPFALKVPFIVNIGLCHTITKNWDIALDWIDIAEQDTRYNKTTERIRVGTEYRFIPFSNKLAISLRTGLASERMTFGIGMNIFRFLQIDGAYAYDNFVKANSYYGQLKIGW